MLSPSHPGPYKATHLAMRDRTVIKTGLVASPVVVSNSVGVERRSTTTCYGANDRALLTTNCCAYCGARTRSDSGR